MKPSEQARRRRARRLCLSLDLDDFAGMLIVDLLERLEEMQREMDRMRAFLEAHDHGER